MRITFWNVHGSRELWGKAAVSFHLVYMYVYTVWTWSSPRRRSEVYGIGGVPIVRYTSSLSKDAMITFVL